MAVVFDTFAVVFDTFTLTECLLHATFVSICRNPGSLCILYVCASLHLSMHMHVCIGLLKHSCLGDNQTRFHVFEQSYDSLSLSVSLSLIFIILWTLDMDNLGLSTPHSSLIYCHYFVCYFCRFRVALYKEVIKSGVCLCLCVCMVMDGWIERGSIQVLCSHFVCSSQCV